MPTRSKATRGGLHDALLSGNRGVFASGRNRSPLRAFDVRIQSRSREMTHDDPSQPPSDKLRLVGEGEPRYADLDIRDHLESDLQALDADLGRLLSGSRGTEDASASDAGLVQRVFEASRVDLPPRVLPIETAPAWSFRRVAAGIGAVAAAVAVAVLAGRVMMVEPSVESGREMAAITVDPVEELSLLEPRESELMLVAVLDPDEGWFDDDLAGTTPDAELVLRSRAFGVDELEGTVFAMLGGPTS